MRDIQKCMLIIRQTAISKNHLNFNSADNDLKCHTWLCVKMSSPVIDIVTLFKTNWIS